MSKSEQLDLPFLPLNQTLSSKAAEALRDAIIKGVVPAGHTLRLDDLAGRFGISRIPLRDALRQLEKEGFVSVIPYRGTKVVPLTLAEGVELCEISQLLHSEAIRPAFPHMTAELLDRSEVLFRRRREVEDTEQWRQLSDEFLKTFYGPGQRPITIELLKNVTDQGLRYWHAILPMRKSAPTAGASFLDVIAACRQGDLDLALARIAAAHQGSIQLITQFFAGREPAESAN